MPVFCERTVRSRNVALCPVIASVTRSFVLFLLPLVASFALTVPGQVIVGKPAQVQWIRHNGDPSSFSLLLRRNDQDHGGTLITTIRSTPDSQGSAQFTVDQATSYLIEIVLDLTPVADDQVPIVRATSSTIIAVQDSNPPDTTQSNSPTNAPTTAPQTTEKTSTSSSSAPASSSSGGSNNNAGGAQTSTASTPTFGGNTVTGSNSAAESTTGSGEGGSGSNTITSTESNTAASPTTTSSSPEPPPSGGTSKRSNVGLIVGCVFAGLIFILIVCCLLFTYNRHKRRKHTRAFAFRRDLMVRPSLDSGSRSPDMQERRSSGAQISFWPVEGSYNTTDFTGSGTQETGMSRSDSMQRDLETYQNYWNSQPNSNEGLNPSPGHASMPSESTRASSSPSVFYTAVPQPVYQTPSPNPPPQQPLYQTQARYSPEFNTGFTFPSRPSPSANSPTVSTPPSTRTDRQIAIQNKMNQLRTQLIVLQSRSARGSGFTDDSSYSSDGVVSGDKSRDREEIVRIREELDRLGEIMNSGWALRRGESGGDVPAGLRV
ncbi:hypothetical protein V5O48_012853 [Marasmius crinis-equi]|uniref:Mid2 domain-containing protein n=1 Tax=Marasmius crinis-equi TaxID=585013 RepID=A0ABR3F1P4_9AGAR